MSHALCDALLGATGKGDIGKHFPDTDPRFAGISSLKLVEEVCTAVRDDGYKIGNIDLTIVCQQPRLAPYLAAMQAQLATTCQSEQQRINIKATTTEKMGYTGRGEGISAHAVVLLYHQQETIS
ncbi:MAG: 2-C-methyl-D-erythritol 2,4-cyclodiphosphate synthase [Deltaproteobacteria bacterium]|nr:MAG: 2-C-methyl-D-erythritol 2,4-cyclodiphosphate synthase [Deltaproteobacteria bacterium]